MAAIRLDSEERHKAIVAAALPLFARKGFAGTTTKELAEAANISEGLLFRHFPSKKHLYGEILRLGCEGDPALQKLAALEPSTVTLVRMTHYMVRYFLLAGEAERTERDSRLRLVLHSFLEDGEYARELFDTIFERVHPLFAASIAAAVAAGDMAFGPIASANSFWLGHHVAAMMAFVLLPARACLSYQGTMAAVVEETTWFILRGIGLAEPAIAAALAASMQQPLELHLLLREQPMDGDQVTQGPGEALAADRALRQRGGDGQAARPRPKMVRWFIIVGLLLAIVLGGLYQFNRFRAHAIAEYFAHNKPPPAQISAVSVAVQSVPRFAPGIGSLTAVHQVTVNPEVAGRVTRIFFQPGETVKAGDPLVQLNDAPDRGDLANYEAQVRLAEITLARSKQLVKRQFTPQETVDQNQSQLDQMNALVQKTQAIIAQKLIRAPFSGQLGVRQIDLGQYLSAGAPIVTLTDLSMLYVNFTLPSQQRSEISVGQQVRVTSDAYLGRSFMAQLTTIEPQLSPDTRTIEVQATMADPGDLLLPGMFVNAAVVLPPQPDTVVVPETAVEYTLYGDSVYVIHQDGKDAKGNPVLKAVRTPVTTGERWGDKVAILSGLKPGEKIVAAGQVKVQNGAQVAVTGSPPPQPPAHPTLH